MKLIDKLMRDICAEMEWGYFEVPEPGTWAYDIKAKLTLVADAVDNVMEAAREALPHLIAAGKADSYSDPDIGLSNAESRLKRALAALDEAVRDES